MLVRVPPLVHPSPVMRHRTKAAVLHPFMAKNTAPNVLEPAANFTDRRRFMYDIEHS